MTDTRKTGQTTAGDAAAFVRATEYRATQYGLSDGASASMPLLSFSGHPGYLAAMQVLLQQPDPSAVAGLIGDMDALGAELARAQANPTIQESIPSADEMLADPSLVRRTLDNNRAMNSIIIMGAAGLLSSARRALRVVDAAGGAAA